MKVPCEKDKKKQQWVRAKGTACEQNHIDYCIHKLLFYCNCNFGICIEISLLIIFIVKTQKAIIHRNGRKNRKQENRTPQ